MSRRPGLLVAALTVAGGVLIVVSFTMLDWLDVTEVDRDRVSRHVYTLPQIFEQRRFGGSAVFVVTHDYITWLGWTLLAGATVLGLVAALRPGGAAVRTAGVIVGVVGAVLTWIATTRMFKGAPYTFTSQFPTHDGFWSAEIGAHLAFVGFLLCAVGAAIGPSGGGVASARRAIGWVRRPFRVSGERMVGGVLTAIGAVALFLAIDQLSWYDTSCCDLPETFTTYELATYAQYVPSRLTRAYFPTLAWVFAATSVAVAIACVAGPRFARIGRWVGVGVAVVAVVVTGYELWRVSSDGHGFTPWYESLDEAPWVLVAGYASCALAGVVAARSRPAPDAGSGTLPP